jgi:hypothetical protein
MNIGLTDMEWIACKCLYRLGEYGYSDAGPTDMGWIVGKWLSLTRESVNI